MSIADVLVRFWGIAWKCMVLVVHAAGSRGELRKRSQVLTVLEQALIFVRHLLPTVSLSAATSLPHPCWEEVTEDDRCRI